MGLDLGQAGRGNDVRQRALSVAGWGHCSLELWGGVGGCPTGKRAAMLAALQYDDPHGSARLHVRRTVIAIMPQGPALQRKRHMVGWQVCGKIPRPRGHARAVMPCKTNLLRRSADSVMGRGRRVTVRECVCILETPLLNGNRSVSCTQALKVLCAASISIRHPPRHRGGHRSDTPRGLRARARRW